MAKVSKATKKLILLSQIDEPAGVVRLEINAGEISELAASIKEVGLLQEILVRPVGDRYEIVFGHRRYLACRSLNWAKMGATVREISDIECALLRATENVHRKDLSPIEEAAVYQDLHETHKLNYDQIGKRMGKSPGVVKRRLDLLKMPPQLQKAVHAKLIFITVAEELWRIRDLAQLDYYLGYAIDHGVTKEVARSWVDDWQKQSRGAELAGAEGSPLPSPSMEAPTYTPCHICYRPVKAGEGVGLMACRSCWNKIEVAKYEQAELSKGGD